MEEIIRDENSENVDDGGSVSIVTDLHKCPKCSRTFVNIGHMKCHFYRVHPEFKLTDFVKYEVVSEPQGKICSSCQLSFKTKKLLNTHNCVFVSSDKLYTCDQCDTSFTQNSALIRHCFKVHRKPRDHICDVCQRGFTSPTKLTSHMRLHELEDKFTRSDSSDAEDEMPPPADDDDDECTADAPADEVIESPSKFVCDVCNQGFRTSTSLKSHALTHEEVEHICEVCNECFSNARDLKKHSQSQHPGDKLFSCSICDASFGNKAGLARHHSVTHALQKSHLCEICNMCLPNKQSLIVHLRKHAKVKPFACAMCDKRFALKCHLSRHVKTHNE